MKEFARRQPNGSRYRLRVSVNCVYVRVSKLKCLRRKIDAKTMVSYFREDDQSTIDYFRMAHSESNVRRKIVPLEIAGEAAMASPSSFWATSSNFLPVLTTDTNPSRAVR